MIIRLTEETSKVGFRIRDWKNSQFLADWPHLQLCIRAGQIDQPRGPNGSPWYLYGYWPGKPTCVDLANPPMPDFPAMVLPAFEKGDNCEVIFHLPKRFHELPYGRYTGILMYCPEGSFHTPAAVSATATEAAQRMLRAWPVRHRLWTALR